MRRCYLQLFRTFFLSLLAVVLVTNNSLACPLVRSEDFNQLQRAKVVVRGKLSSEPQFIASPGKLNPKYFRAKVLVIATLAGQPKLDGTEVEFVFYRPINRNVKGLLKDVEIIVGLREPNERERSAGHWYIESKWFSVASQCDSKGVVIVNESNIGDVFRGIKGQHKRRD